MVRDSAACLNAADSGVESVVGGFSLGLGAWAGPGCTGWQAWFECRLGIMSSLKLLPTDEPTVPVICFPWAVSVGI